MRRNGFHQVIQDERPRMTAKQRRYNELCYVCGQKCRSTGKSVPIVGRVCITCYSTIIMEGVKVLMSIIKGRPEFMVTEVNEMFSEEKH